MHNSTKQSNLRILYRFGLLSYPENDRRGLTAPAPEIGKQAEAEPKPVPTPGQEPEASDSSPENVVYIPGFGWIESQSPNQVEYAEDMCENGNKIGSMG